MIPQRYGACLGFSQMITGLLWCLKWPSALLLSPAVACLVLCLLWVTLLFFLSSLVLVSL